MDHIDVDQCVVAHDVRLGGMNETHPTHVGGKLVDLVKLLSCSLGQPNCFFAICRLTKIKKTKVIGRCGRKLWMLDVHAAHPVPIGFETLHQMTGDESTRATNHGSFHESIPWAVLTKASSIRSTIASFSQCASAYALPAVANACHAVWSRASNERLS